MEHLQRKLGCRRLHRGMIITSSWNRCFETVTSYHMCNSPNRYDHTYEAVHILSQTSSFRHNSQTLALVVSYHPSIRLLPLNAAVTYNKTVIKLYLFCRVIPNSVMKAKSERRRPFIGDQVEECRDASGLFYILPFQKVRIHWS